MRGVVDELLTFSHHHGARSPARQPALFSDHHQAVGQGRHRERNQYRQTRGQMRQLSKPSESYVSRNTLSTGQEQVPL